MALLDSLNKKDVSEFKKDFIQLIRVAVGMDKYFSGNDKDFDKYLPRYKKLISLFNEKYSRLQLKFVVNFDESRLLILFKGEKSVKDVFLNAASKIVGLKSIGTDGFGEVDVKDSEKFSKKIESAGDCIYLSYYHQEAGSDTIYLEYNKKYKMVELHYDFKGVFNEKGPEFKLCAFFALSGGFKKIDFFSEAASFGFIDLLSDDEKKEWLDDFNPRLEE
ncbi:hypothetical protein J4209_01565 [Candidatus Woesearchaeota archaeon]|nr:hypothetical protein [Candidatus Woesearchaeota archaeon]